MDKVFLFAWCFSIIVEFGSKEPFLAITSTMTVLCHVKDVEATDVAKHTWINILALPKLEFYPKCQISGMRNAYLGIITQETPQTWPRNPNIING